MPELFESTSRTHPLLLPSLASSVVRDAGGVDPMTGGDRYEPPVRASDVLFTPNENAYDYEVRCLREVITARRSDPRRYAPDEDPYSILYAVYNLRNRRVFDELVEAQRLGIHVQVLIEADQLAPDRPHNKLAEWFAEAGLSVVRSDRALERELGDGSDAYRKTIANAHLVGIDDPALMHMKSRIFRWRDPESGELRQKLLMGPLNPGGDPVKNDEHLNVFSDPALVDRFRSRFYEVRAHQAATNTWSEAIPINILFTPHTPESVTPAKKLFEWIDRENELIVMSIFCLRNLTAKGERETLVEKLIRAKDRGAKVLVLTDMRKSDGRTLTFDERGRPKRNAGGAFITELVEMYGEDAGDDPTDEQLEAGGIKVLEVVNPSGPHSAMHERFTILGLHEMRVVTSEGNYTAAAMGSRRGRPRNQESYAFIDSGRYDGNYTGRAFLGRALQLLRKYDSQLDGDSETLIRELQTLPAWPKLWLDPLSLIPMPARAAFGSGPSEKLDLVLSGPIERTIPLPSVDRIGSLRSRRRPLELPFGSILTYRTKDARTGALGELHHLLIADAPDHPAPEL